MKRYWFYGTMPSNTISESDLTDTHKDIIKKERARVNDDNYYCNWIGYKKKDGWDFMRHGFEVVFIEEEKANVARKKFYSLLDQKYNSTKTLE